MKRIPKKLLALLLCTALWLGSGFVPAAAASVTYFPEFQENIGVGMRADDPWPAIGSNSVPSQTYFQQTDDWDNCLFLAEKYIDLLVKTGDFEVVYPLKVVRGKEDSGSVRYSCHLRYTGSADMKGTLKAMRADKTWPDYGAYHIIVQPERESSRPDASRRNSITVRWDSALRPEGIDFYADSDMGDDRSDNTNRDQNTGNAGNTGNTGNTGNIGNTVGNSDNTFQDLNSAMGYYLSCSDDGFYYEDTNKKPMSYDELLQIAQEYVDLLVGEDNFYLVSSRKNGQLVTRNDIFWSGGKSSTWYIGYAGTAPMEENLAAGDAIDWNNYGPFHLKVAVWDSGKSDYITVAWDNGLRPVESNRRTSTGAKLGSAERPQKTMTAVLGIGYNKMCVGDTISQVDEKQPKITPIVENGRTLVPVSRIVAAIGGESTWTKSTRTAGFSLGNRSVSVTVGSKDIILRKGSQQRKVTMEAAAKIVSGRTYVPLRYVLEGLGLWVGYEPTYRLVVVSTENLDGENLIELPESQRLFDSEEVPETARKYLERYTIDDFNYTMEVGESLTLYNSYKSSGDNYAYSWNIVDGGELVKANRNQATCRFYAKRPGKVTIRSYVDENWGGNGVPFRNNTVTYDMTITITPATSQGSRGGLMTWGPCPSCNGTGKIRVGTQQKQCPTCLGQKQILQ